MPASIAVGALVAGKYRLEREIGSGGMGIVFAARHVHLDQRVALKFLLTEAATPEVLERFYREARAAVKVQSEHVARVMDIGDLDGQTPYIVMEYLEGDDLENIVKATGPLPVHDAIRYLLEACEALAEVHAQGIVHRDIKPANLFVTSRADGSTIVKLLDFGISKTAQSWERQADGSDKANRLTHTSAVIGSPRYMSPEQLRSSRDVDARTDVWALGVTLFELLGGNSPFASGTMPEVCASILKDAPLPLSELRPEVPAELEAVIKKCLEKKPEHRWEDVGELAVALRPFGPVGTSALSAERVTGVLQQHLVSLSRPGTAPPPVISRSRTGQGTLPHPNAPSAPSANDETSRTNKSDRHDKLGLRATEFVDDDEPRIARAKTEKTPVPPSLPRASNQMAAVPMPDDMFDLGPAGKSAPHPLSGQVPTGKPVGSTTAVSSVSPGGATHRRPTPVSSVPIVAPPIVAKPAAIAPAEPPQRPSIPRVPTTLHGDDADEALELHYLKQLGGTIHAVPHRLMDLAKMTSLSLDHRAGFVMSRMDGITTIEELLDLSGMARLETLKLLCELLDHRLIRVEVTKR